MKESRQDDKLRQYLLGQLAEHEQAQIEEQLFLDDELFDQLQAIKSELADAYSREQLSARDREQFEKRFSNSPTWRKQVQFSNALAAALAEGENKAPVRTSVETVPWWQSALGFFHAQTAGIQLAIGLAMLALLIGGFWIASKNIGLRQQLEQNRQAQTALEEKRRAIEEQLTEERARGERSASQLEIERQQLAQLQQERDALEKQLNQLIPLVRPAVSLALFAGTRGNYDASKSLIVSREAREIELKLYFEGASDYESYRAELRTTGGKMIWRKDKLPVAKTGSGNTAALRLPASFLAKGEYEVALGGITGQGQFEDIGYYYFSALKR